MLLLLFCFVVSTQALYRELNLEQRFLDYEAASHAKLQVRFKTVLLHNVDRAVCAARHVPRA
jgi:hypothetical protein